ncbi:MAG: hypothetical protein JWM86_2375 [Thermoleophilia bacterium]|nr:hypothetical protein [Thermoleophilia bacterium]
MHVIRTARSLVTLAALGTFMAAAPVAQASTPPTAPTNTAVTVVQDGARTATTDITWTASTDSDGTVASYDVSITEGDAIRVLSSTTTSLRVSLTRGRAYDIRVAAVDNSGDRSLAGSPVSLRLATTKVTLAVGARARGALAQSCVGVAGACTFRTLVGATYALRASSTTPLAGTLVELTPLWRRPGVTRFVQRVPVFVKLGATGGSLALSRVVKARGTWCVRVRLASGDLAVRAPAPGLVCVKY